MYCLRMGRWNEWYHIADAVVLIELQSYVLRKRGNGTSIGQRRKTSVVVTTEVNIYNNTEDEMEIYKGH